MTVNAAAYRTSICGVELDNNISLVEIRNEMTMKRKAIKEVASAMSEYKLNSNKMVT